MVEEVKKLEEGKKEEAKAEEKKDEAKVEVKKDGGGGGAGEGEKKEGGGGEEKKVEAPPPPPPPEEIVMKVFMHCEGCGRKVKRCLKGFDGVEDVMMDSKSHKVVVKGKKAAEDPMKVVDRVAKKTGRKVELLTPLPPAKLEKGEKKEEEIPKPEEKKGEPPVIVTVVLKVHMHCEACALEIKKRILKMKGVQAAEADLKASQVTVKGIFEPPKLVEYVYKKTGKHAVIVKQEPAEKKADDEKKAEAAGDAAKDEKKTEGDGDKSSKGDKKDDKDAKADDKEKKGNNAASEDPMAAAAAAKVLDMRNEFQYNPYHQFQYNTYRVAYPYHQYPQMFSYHHQYPQMFPYHQYPQMFSDENPNGCTVM